MALPMALPLVGSAVSALASGVLSGGAGHLTQNALGKSDEKPADATSEGKQGLAADHKPADVSF